MHSMQMDVLIGGWVGEWVVGVGGKVVGGWVGGLWVSTGSTAPVGTAAPSGCAPPWAA